MHEEQMTEKIWREEKEWESEWARAKQRGARGRKSPRQLDGLPGSTFHSSNEKITKDVSLQWVSGICSLSLSLPPPPSLPPLSLPLFPFLPGILFHSTTNLRRPVTYIGPVQKLIIEFILKREKSSHTIRIVARTLPDWLIWRSFRYVVILL